MNEKYHKVSDRVFWLVFAAMLGVYLTMVIWSIPLISSQADGLPIFDMRPGGYTFDEAKTFLAALSPEGAKFYVNVQHRLDIVYPALLAITLFWAILRLTPVRWGRWRWLLAATAIPGSVFDYWENANVAFMLKMGPAGLTTDFVAAASFHSQAKAICSSVSMAILLVLLSMWAYRCWRGKHRLV